MYGINKKIREETLKKIQKQRDFYEKFHFDFNKIVDGKLQKVPIKMIDLVKSPIFNQNKYIAEIQERVNSLNNYANLNNLKPLFITITLPSEYHKYKTLSNGKIVKNPNFAKRNELKKLIKSKEPLTTEILEKYNEKNYSPNAGAKYLSKVFKKMIDLRILKTIPKEKKCYFRVYEPHESGTPHLHLNFFVPAELIEEVYKNLINYFKNNYNARVDIQKDIKNNTAYLMKYILKTLDDMRTNTEYSDLSIWYIHNKITRFYTSRTLIALEVYRKVYNHYGLLELTYAFKNREINYFIDTESKEVVQIVNKYTNLYFKKSTLKDFFEFDQTNKQIKQCRKNFNAKVEFEKTLKNKKDLIPVLLDGIEFYLLEDGSLKRENQPARTLSDLKLIQNYNYLSENIENIDINRFYIFKNEMIKRGLLNDKKIHLDKYLDKFGFTNLENHLPEIDHNENFSKIEADFELLHKETLNKLKKEQKENIKNGLMY